MYQSITIIGRLGHNPDMKLLPSGTPVTTFSVATDYKYTSNGEQVKETTWFRVSVFGKTAENCNQYLAKGSLVQVEGRLSPDKSTGGPRVWEKDGVAKSSFELKASNVLFLSKSGNPAQQQEAVNDLDEIPF